MTTLSPDHAAASDAAIRERCDRLAESILAMDHANRIDEPRVQQARDYAAHARSVIEQAERILADAREHLAIAEQSEVEAGAAERY
jgi:hypothetical protein